MPKKTRKMKQRAAMRRSLVQPQVEEQEIADPVMSGETTLRMRPTFSSVRTSLQEYDYSHIYGDLRRIALFAGFFFAVLVILSFVIK